MRVAILPALDGNEEHLLGFDVVLVGGGAWDGSWFGRAKVVRASAREDGVALVVGSDPDEIAERLLETPDPVILVLYNGPRSPVVKQAISERRRAGKDARLATGKATATIENGVIVEWTHESEQKKPKTVEGEA